MSRALPQGRLYLVSEVDREVFREDVILYLLPRTRRSQRSERNLEVHNLEELTQQWNRLFSSFRNDLQNCILSYRVYRVRNVAMFT